MDVVLVVMGVATAAPLAVLILVLCRRWGRLGASWRVPLTIAAALGLSFWVLILLKAQ